MSDEESVLDVKEEVVKEDVAEIVRPDRMSRRDMLLTKWTEGAPKEGEPAERLSEFLNQCVEEVSKEMGADTALLFGYNPQKQEWFFCASYGMPNDFGKKEALSRAWQSLPTIVLKHGPNLFSDDIAKDRHFIGQMIRGTLVSTFAGTTLQEGEAIRGSFAIGVNRPNAFTEEDRGFFVSISKLLFPFLPVPDFTPVHATAPMLQKPESRPEPNSEPRHEQPSEPKRDLKPEEKQIPMEEPKPKIEPRIKPEVAQNIEPKAEPKPRGRMERDEKEPERNERREHRIVLMEALFSTLSSVFHGEDFSTEILRKILPLLEADGGMLFRLEPTNQRFFPVASEGILLETAKRIEKSGVRADPIWTKAIDKNMPMLLSADAWKSSLKKRLFGEESLQSHLMMPLRSGNRLWGILSLFHRTRTFSQKEVALLEWIAEKVSRGFEALTTFDTMQKKMETMALAQAFFPSVAMGPSAVLVSILNGIKRIARVSNCYLFLMDQQAGVLYGAAASNPAEDLLEGVEIKLEEDAIVPLTVKENGPLVVENALSDPRIGQKWIERFRSRSLFSVPLQVKGQVIGVLLLEETAYFRRFTEAEIQTVLTLSHSAAISIDTAIHYQKAIQEREHQETLSMAVLNLHESERRQTSKMLGKGAGAMLDEARKEMKKIEASADLLPTTVKSHLTAACRQIDQAVENLKTLSSDLHSDLLETQGLVPALQAYTDLFSRMTSVSVQWHLPAPIKGISPRLEMFLYRTVQEAIVNVSNHAAAKSVVIAIEKQDPYLHLSITDDGNGFDAKRYFAAPPHKRKGMGILGMKGRVELLGGIFFIESKPEEGTRVSIKVPLMKRRGTPGGG